MMSRRIARAIARFTALPARINRIQEALGRIEQRQTAQSAANPAQAEFRVFSQWGEDGIVQHLIARVAIARPIFVEFGVENYTESNTRFLLINNQWAGLVIDGSGRISITSGVIRSIGRATSRPSTHSSRGTTSTRFSQGTASRAISGCCP